MKFSEFVMMKRARHGIIFYFAAFSGTLVIYTAVPHFRDSEKVSRCDNCDFNLNGGELFPLLR